jgi:hypothetical protein
MRRPTTIFIALIISTISVIGQQSWTDRLYFEANYHYGFLLPAANTITYFINDDITGYQINIGILSNGQKRWQQDYNYPQTGLGFYHSGLANNQIFGNVSAAFFYFDKYFFRLNRRFNLGNRIEYGFGYVNRTFDLKSNPYDGAISSHLNIYLNYSLEAIVRINPLWQLKLGAGFSHLSNGRTNLPNKGLNIITSFAGIQYSFQNPYNYVSDKKLEDLNNQKNKFIIIAGYGNKQIYRNLPKHYNAYAFSLEYSHRIFHNRYLGLVLNTYYDSSMPKELELAGENFENSDYMRVALNLSYEIQMGRFSYLFQPGIYLKNPFPGDKKYSNCFGLRYSLNKHWMMGASVKAHWVAIADFLEWNVAYRL